MERDWNDFKSLHSNIAGAREAFERACESLFRKIYAKKNVQQVAVKKGDDGIDIFIGEIGIEPITVIQCKFFIDQFSDSQHAQVRSSFKTSIESSNYSLEKWILCLPRILTLDESVWWSGWKSRKIKEHSKDEDFINLKNGSELIDLLKEHGLYNQVFKMEDSLLIKDSNEKLDKLISHILPKHSPYSTSSDSTSSDTSKILFNNYTIDSEPYYQERKIDTEFINHLNLSNIWVYGKSGKGKTALIQRNLIRNEIKFLFCDMSPISIRCIDDIFAEIKDTIKTKYNPRTQQPNTNNIKEICSLLNACNFRDKIVIVIDELSLPNGELEIEFAECVLNLVNYYNNQDNNFHLKFVISTISKPTDILIRKAKATSHFSYLSSDNWDNYIIGLFDILNNSLNLNINDNNKEIILMGVDATPRLLSSIFRKIVASGDTTDQNIQLIVEKAIDEYF